MARLILFLVLLIAAFAAAALVLQAGARLVEATASTTGREVAMPSRFSKIAYVLLIVLMFSATAGAL